MAYRYDEDLEFLRDVKSSDLNDLVDVLTKDKDGEKRITEHLTTNDLYQQYYPDHKNTSISYLMRFRLLVATALQMRFAVVA